MAQVIDVPGYGPTEFPDNMSDADIVKAIQAQQPQQPQDQPWGDVAIQAVKNIPSSAGNLASGLYQAVRHPIKTASSALDLAAGELQKITPKPIRDLINQLDWNPEAAQRAEQTASTINDFYAKRYGSEQGFKEAIATDPVGVATDLSAVLGVGGAVIPGKVGTVLTKASLATNPINIAAKGIKGVAKLAGTAGKSILGVSTGVGGEAITEAAKAGFKGNKAFQANMRGKVPTTDVLQSAKMNLEAMKIAKSAEYRNNMAALAKDKTVLDFSNIDGSINSAQNILKYKGQVKNPIAAKYVQKVQQAIDNWKGLDPKEYHTPEGLDALKQQVGGILEKIPYEQKTARLAVGNIYHSIKDSIANQAPAYSEIMSNYSQASDKIDEITKALIGGNKAAADTSMRRLQSLMRNNVNTNYGNRLNLARTLEQQGGNEIIPALAGQALNSWEPRGLSRFNPVATGIGATIKPGILAALPLQSPRLMGEALYGAGRIAGMGNTALQALPLSSESAKLAALLAAKGGSLLGAP